MNTSDTLMKKISALLVLSCTVLLAASATGDYRFIREIPIGGTGGWDYLSIDAQARRLYVAHANRIVVVDLNENRVVGEIEQTPGVHGFAIAPPRGFSSNGRENKVSVVDLKTLGTITKVETGENPDAILYEPSRDEVYAFNGRGHSATVINAKNPSVVTTIPLGGKPEFAVADAESNRVFCNIEDKSEVLVIDTKTHKVSSRWPLTPGQEPTGLAFDRANHRLFCGCSNKLLVMLDTETGKVLANAPIGAGVDACAYDATSADVFASCGDGTVTIAKESDGKLDIVQVLQTERGARTMALDPVTHHIYFATAKFEPDRKDERGRPTTVEGTFHLLEYGPK